ncbi:hypothetical protein [Nannocystis pusilla]|uniref:Lipoprotein n=1 Tax=Nannocystis pusilla TaxID=889268 RepID=A0ABS7TZ48_9BACT|nr:hypothetical protein [Nannocystis pusilla]MBZ5713479.1 hypothetical protein [Nannocystis pusilla]
MPLTLGVFVAVAACHEEIELDGLTVLPEFSEPICGGTLERMERRLDWLVEVTGVPRADRPIKVHWTRYSTGEGGSKETHVDRRGRVYTSLEFFTHELVHGHLNRFEYQRPWLAEGLAFMLEDGVNSPPSAFVSPAELLAARRSRDLDYFAAGNFVRVLRETYGMERLMRLYALSEDTTYAEAKRVFKSALGESFDDVSERYAAPYTVWRIGSPDCEYPRYGARRRQVAPSLSWRLRRPEQHRALLRAVARLPTAADDVGGVRDGGRGHIPGDSRRDGHQLDGDVVRPVGAAEQDRIRRRDRTVPRTGATPRDRARRPRHTPGGGRPGPTRGVRPGATVTKRSRSSHRPIMSERT